MHLQVASFATGYADICLLLPMDRFMSLQVRSWSEWFTTELANMCFLPTMEKCMHLQFGSWSEWFPTELANMCLQPTMEKFMHLHVGSWSEWFTTDLVNMCLLPTMEKFMHLQVAWQVNDLIQKLHMFFPIMEQLVSFQGLCFSESFTTRLTSMWLHLPMDRFMSLRVISGSLGFTTVLTDIGLFPALGRDLPMKMQTFDFSQLWVLNRYRWCFRFKLLNYSIIMYVTGQLRL